MADGRGMPLLSGPPTKPDPSADISCRKCNKDLRGLFARERRCNHCGYMYCSSDSPYTALMPRPGPATGYDAAPVCSFCIEFLTMTAAGRAQLKAMPLAKLRRYIDAYNLKATGVIEKGELVDIIINARTESGCLSRDNEEWYRRNSVPSSQNNNPRGFFARNFGDAPTPQPRLPRNRLNNQQSVPNFARPDLDHSDDPQPGSFPPRTSYNPPPGPPPPRQQRAPSAGPGYHPRNPAPTQSPHPATASPPPRPRTTPPQAAPAPPPPPPPSLDELLNMTREAIRGLPISSLKSILFQNHVRPGAGVLEKGELVDRVLSMVDDERNERARDEARRAEEEEEARAFAESMRMERERLAREREARERGEPAPIEPAAAPSEAATDDQAHVVEMAEANEAQPSVDVNADGEVPRASTKDTPPPEPKPLPPKAQAMAAHLERTGLCVICQDADANMAIIDCGHLAMCRGCSDLIMASTRECPLCRTRIITEQRLLRIFKA